MRMIAVNFLLFSFEAVLLPVLHSAGLGTAILHYVVPQNTTK